MSRFAYIFLLLFLAFSILARLWLTKPQGLPRNRDLKFEATIKNEPKIYETGQVISVADAKIYADLYPKYWVGDRILVSGKIDEEGKMFRAKVEKIGQGGGLAGMRSKVRDKISRNISSLLPAREATLISGAVLGVDNIGKEFHDELVKTGTIHVVVVSGQNLMIVAGIFMALAPYIGRRKSLALATLAVFAYAFLTGFEPPVLRAAVMVFVTTVALYFGRMANVLWTLGLAAVFIVFLFPQSLFEVSFQLTFAATLGIVTLGKVLEEKWRNLPFLGQNAAIATSAYLFTAPIIIFYFGRISPIAPLANILVAEAVFPMMVLGFLTAILSLIFMPLAQIMAYFAFVPALYFSGIVRVFAAMPIAQYSFGQGNWIMAIVIYLALVAFLWITRAKQY